MSLRVVALFIFLMLPGLAISQVIDDDKSRSGSYYSSIGYGIPTDVNSSYTSGIGLSGVSTYSSFSPSISNPAHWGLVELTQGQISLGMTNFEASDGTSEAKYSKFGFENFQFVFPLLRNQLGVSVSFSPFTRADFARVKRGEFFTGNDLFDEVEFATNTVGSGGANRIEVGLGYRLSRNISVGYAASAYLLSLNEEHATSFSQQQYQRGNQPIVLNEEITGSGFGNRFGIYTRFRELLGDNDRLSIGGSVNLPVNISAERSVATFRRTFRFHPTYSVQVNRVELNEGMPNREGSVKIPLEINGGLTYYLNQYHSFSAEALMQSWSDSEFSYRPAEENYYTDRTKVGIGYQFHPFLNQQSSGFFSNFRYSLGATYDTGFLAISDQDIETYMLHAGITIPSQRNRSSIDLSFNYGMRGTQTNSLVKENIWGFKLSLNLAEFMFLRQRFQ